MKPIKLTKELIAKMTQEFAESLAKISMSDGKVTYTKTFTYEKDKDDTGAEIWFEPEAYAKMLLLLHGFSDEVAWHGVVERQSSKVFVIKDIMVYPQEVTGATVTTDQERYQKWLMELDDDTFDHLRMQGHSHVNMATHPSDVDEAFYESILKQLTDEDYYIFMIFNKRLEHTVKIYDMKNNILFEDKDIFIGITSPTGDLETFVKNAKDIVVNKPYAYSAGAKSQSPDKTKESKKDAKKDEKGKVRPYPGLYAGSEYDYSDRDGGSYGGYGSYGSYGGYGYDSGKVTDYDAEIFGKKRSNWWDK